MKILLLLALSLPLFAVDQALIIDSLVNRGTFTVPSTSPFTSRLGFRFETRIIGTGGTPNTPTCAGAGTIWPMGGGYELACFSSTQFAFWDHNASVGALWSVPADADIELRLQWDPTGAIGPAAFLQVEEWDTATAAPITQANRNAAASTAQNLAGLVTVGSASNLTTMRVAWARWYSTLVPLGGAAPLNGVSSCADLGDWELDGVLTDCSGNGMTISMVSPTYVNAPTYNPIPVPRLTNGGAAWMQNTAIVGGVRAGQTWNATAVASVTFTNPPVFTVTWSQLSGPGTATFSSTSSVTPTITFPNVFGTYVFQLSMTDSINTETATLTIGAVIYDANGVVDGTSIDSQFNLLYQPMIALGKEPNPYQGYQNWNYAQGLEYAYANNPFYNGVDWSTPQTGTVDVSGTSLTAHTGSGANLITSLNCGAVVGTAYTVTNATWSSSNGGLATYTIGTNGLVVGQTVTIAGVTPSGYNVSGVIVQGGVTSTTITLAVASNPGSYVSGGTATAANQICQDISLFYTSTLDGLTAYAGFPVTSCSSATSCTMGKSWPLAALTTAQFGYVSCQGCWIGGSDNFNYYDAAGMGFYSTGYRSGLTQYIMDARTYASRWWNNPYFSRGDCFNTGSCTGGNHLPPRVLSLRGVIWWLHETGAIASQLPGLRNYWTDDVNQANANTLFDIRENSYQVCDLAMAWLFDPANASTYKTALTNWINGIWTTSEQPSTNPPGNYPLPVFGFSSLNGLPGTASVNSSSSTVTGSSTLWATYNLGNALTVGSQAMAWFTTDPTAVTGDNYAYLFTVNSSTSLTLYDWNPALYNASPLTYTPSTVNYKGTTGSGKFWSLNNLAGTPGTESFIAGIAAHMFNIAYRTGINIPKIPLIAQDFANWVANFGYHANSGGVYYSRGFQCEQYGSNPPPDAIPTCSADVSLVNFNSAQQMQNERFTNGEDVAGISQLYLTNPTPALATLGDELVGKALGGYASGTFGSYYGDFTAPYNGGPQSDGITVIELNDNCPVGWQSNINFVLGCQKPKDFGFWYGVGASWMWPAARAGSLITPGSVGSSSGVSSGIGVKH